MADDKNYTGFPDNVLINTNEDYEVQYWADKFGCTKDQLKACAKETGSSSVKKIAKCLKDKGQLKNGSQTHGKSTKTTAAPKTAATTQATATAQAPTASATAKAQLIELSNTPL